MRNQRRPAIEPLEAKSLLSAGPGSSGLAETLTVSRATATPGEPIVLTYTRTNVGHHDLNVTEGPSRDGFVISRGGAEVWRSNRGPTPMFVVLKTLRPGESTTIQATWHGQADPGAPAPQAGTFVVANQDDPGGPKATVTIVPAGHHPSPHTAPGPAAPPHPRHRGG